MHVNRAPIAGKITNVEYTKGQFLVASREIASAQNERNTVSIAGDGTCVRFTQIAGLIARRIVFYKKPGDTVAKGERVGLIKFGSRVDVFLGPEWEIVVRPGERVAGGSSILARRRREDAELMARLTFKERFFDPRPPARRPRRAAYALPTLFTARQYFPGIPRDPALLRGRAAGFQRATRRATRHFEVAAKAIGAAVVLDGLDGRIARMTNTTSDFGREMDSLADVISFGIAPAVLAYAWGVQFVDARRIPAGSPRRLLPRFLFLLCGAARLARFNVQKNPVPKNPGRPDRKYFVGLPIPAAAGMVAAVVYASDSVPLRMVDSLGVVAGAAGAACRS